MVVQDPVVLRAHERRDRGRRHAGEHVGARQAEQLQVVEKGLVVAELLVDVLVEVGGERLGEPVAAQLTRPFAGR